MLELGRKGNSMWLSSAQQVQVWLGNVTFWCYWAAPLDWVFLGALEVLYRDFWQQMVPAECPIGTLRACEYSWNRSFGFQSAWAFTMPHPNAMHILMQIKDHCNISYLFLAGFSSERTDFTLTPRQASKEWNGWWTCFPKGFVYLTFWCLFDLNIFPSFEALGEQRGESTNTCLCPSPLGVQKTSF